MAFEQPWMPPEYRPTAFTDAWSISEIFNKETEMIARALQKTINDDVLSPEVMIDTFLAATVSGGSQSETFAAVKARRIGPAPSGRVTKRRSRPSKRALTTFISADPENFRQMVQQVTGAGFAAAALPDPNRRLDTSWPTIDTSSLYIDGAATVVETSDTATKAVGGGAKRAALNFDSFCSFPTLESWKVM